MLDWKKERCLINLLILWHPAIKSRTVLAYPFFPQKKKQEEKVWNSPGEVWGFQHLSLQSILWVDSWQIDAEAACSFGLTPNKNTKLFTKKNTLLRNHHAFRKSLPLSGFFLKNTWGGSTVFVRCFFLWGVFWFFVVESQVDDSTTDDELVVWFTVFQKYLLSKWMTMVPPGSFWGGTKSVLPNVFGNLKHLSLRQDRWKFKEVMCLNLEWLINTDQTTLTSPWPDIPFLKKISSSSNNIASPKHTAPPAMRSENLIL